MKERGLGTSATRAAIIERLIDVEFVQRENKAIIPTTKGIELIRVIEMIPIPELASPELTGNWEHQLVQIEKGQTLSSHFMEEIIRLTRDVVDKVKEAKEVDAFRAAVNEPLGNSPLCGGEIRETKMAYSCSNWKEQGCKFAIWKRIAGKTLTRGQANELLSKGRVGPLFGFRSRAGKPFRAILVLQGEKVSFEFLNDRPAYIRKEKAKAVVEEGSSSSLPSPKRKVVRRKTITPSLEKAANPSKKRSPGKTKESKPHSSKNVSSQAVDKAPVAKKTVRKRIAVGGTGSKKTTAVDKVDVDKDVLPKKTARTRKNRIAEEEKKEGSAS